jgi:TRAP-type uncharacterized transport system fused permease subunit
MRGDPLTIAWAALTAALGVWMGTIGVVGYYSAPISIALRVLYVLAGVLLLIPADAFKGAIFTDVAGLMLGAVLLGREVFRRRASARLREGA